MPRIVADPKPARLPLCVVDASFGDLIMTRTLTRINITGCRLRRGTTTLTHVETVQIEPANRLLTGLMHLIVT